MLALLISLDPFTGYLKRVHGAGDKAEQSNLLTLLNDFARAYWTTDVFPDSSIEYLVVSVKDYIRNLCCIYRISDTIMNFGVSENVRDDELLYLAGASGAHTASLKLDHETSSSSIWTNLSDWSELSRS